MPAKSPEPMKVMDVTHPSRVQPNTTSRPVIVPSRPMVAADPMIAQSAMDVLTKSGAEKSAGDPVGQLEHTPELVIDRMAKTVTPDEVEQQAETTPDVAADEKAKSTEPTLAGVPPVDTAAAKELESPIIEITKPAEVTQAVDVAPASDEHKDESPSEVANPLAHSQSTFEMSESEDDETSDDDTTPEKTTEQKQAENIEKLIASRLYAVPIGKRAKRRARMILLTLLIVLLALITVDLILDMGFLKLPSIPHTTFFSL